MPNITLSLNDSEFADLQSISEERQDDSVEITGHALLADAIAREMQASPAARARSYNRGVTSARGKARFTDGVIATLRNINHPSYPVRRKP